MIYVWAATHSPAVPLDWKLTDIAPETLALIIYPLLDDMQSRVWAKSVLLDQYSNDEDIAFTFDKLTQINGVKFPFPTDQPNRNLFVPLYMLTPELGSQFEMEASTQAAPNGAPVRSAGSLTIGVEAVQPGAYQAANLLPGQQWTPDLYRAVVNGETQPGGVFLKQPDVRIASAPISDTEKPAFDFVFLSPQFTEPLNPLVAVPVDLDFYNRWAARDDVQSVSSVNPQTLITIAGISFVVYLYLKARRIL